MIVCICRRFSDSQIVCHARAGMGFEEIQFELGEPKTFRAEYMANISFYLIALPLSLVLVLGSACWVLKR